MFPALAHPTGDLDLPYPADTGPPRRNDAAPQTNPRPRPPRPHRQRTPRTHRTHHRRRSQRQAWLAANYNHHRSDRELHLVAHAAVDAPSDDPRHQDVVDRPRRESEGAAVRGEDFQPVGLNTNDGTPPSFGRRKLATVGPRTRRGRYGRRGHRLGCGPSSAGPSPRHRRPRRRLGDRARAVPVSRERSHLHRGVLSAASRCWVAPVLSPKARHRPTTAPGRCATARARW